MSLKYKEKTYFELNLTLIENACEENRENSQIYGDELSSASIYTVVSETIFFILF